EDGRGNPMRRRQKGNQESLLGRSINHDSTVTLQFMHDVVCNGDAGTDRVVQVMRETYDIAWHRVVGHILMEARRGRGGVHSVAAVTSELVGAHMANDKGR